MFLLDTVVGMVSVEQNAIIMIFPVAAVVFMPPTLVAWPTNPRMRCYWYHCGTRSHEEAASHNAEADIFASRKQIDPLGADIESLFAALGGEISSREGARIGVFLFGEVRVFHRPHPSPDTDKGAVESIRKWLESHGVEP